MSVLEQGSKETADTDRQRARAKVELACKGRG